MVGTLILMRHCKSSWDHPGLRDHDRPLNGRGTRSATALGDWLRHRGHLPDLALISTSRRTMETFEGLHLECESRYLSGLYHAGASAMMASLRSVKAETVLMIGHNPGIADFAERLLAQPVMHDRFWDYPTGATLVAQFDAPPDWGGGRAVDFVIPRELTGG